MSSYCAKTYDEKKIRMDTMKSRPNKEGRFIVILKLQQSAYKKKRPPD